jgi:hypothetical protein
VFAREDEIQAKVIESYLEEGEVNANYTESPISCSVLCHECQYRIFHTVKIIGAELETNRA